MGRSPHPRLQRSPPVQTIRARGCWWDRKTCVLPPVPSTRGFPGGSVGKESDCDVGDTGSSTGWGRSPGGGNGSPLLYSCLESSMNRGASYGLQSVKSRESDRTEQLNHHRHQHHHHQGLEPGVAGQSHSREGMRILIYS